MFSPFFRLLLLLACIAISILGAMNNNWILLSISTIASALLLWDYLRASTITLALRRYYQSRYEEMSKLLEHVRNPKRLSKKNEARFYFLKAVEAWEKDDFKSAKIALLEALHGNMSKETLETRAYLLLIDISILLKDNKQAKDYFEQLRGRKIEKKLLPTLEKLQMYFSNK